MTPELAEHISLLAAPMMATMLAPYLASGKQVSVEALATLRTVAIQQAHALWLDTLETPG